MNTTAPVTAPVATPNRWPKRLMWTIGFLALLWFGPAIIANSPWRDYAINAALGKINGRIVTKSASLWWFSPINVSGLRIDDTAGKPLVDVAQIRTSKSLLALLSDRSDLGEIRIEKPSVHLVMSDQSSNLQDALLPLLTNTTNGDRATPLFAVVVEGGTITMEDEITSKSWECQSLMLDFQSKETATKKYLFKAKGSINAPGGAPAAFEGQGELASQSDQGLTGEVRLVAAKLPLDALTPWLRRLPDPVRIEGALSGEATYRWTAANQHALGLKQVSADTLAITAPKQLGPATFVLNKLAAQGKIAVDAERAVFEGFLLDSTAAKVEASGGASLQLISKPGDLNEVGALLHDEDLKFKAEFDVAAAAQAFPDLLRIRRGTEVKSGKLYFDLNSEAKGETRTWTGGVHADALTALYQGKSIVWEKPVDLTFEARREKNGIVIDQLKCDSSFLKATGSASGREGSFQGEADLSTLHAELSRFADLGDFQLRGKLQSRMNWKQLKGDTLELTTDSRIDNFELRLPGKMPWEERELTIQSTAELVLQGTGIAQVSAGDLSIVSGRDRFSTALLAPVTDPFGSGEWPIRLEGSGKLETWKARLENFLPIKDWELGGQFTLQAEGALATNFIRWTTARGNAQQLKAFGPSVYIQEPRIELLDSKGQVDLTQSEVQVSQLTAQGSSISLLAENVVIRPTAGDLVLRGRVDYEAKLDALQAWTHHPKLPSELVIQGKAKGSLLAETDEKSALLDYSFEISPLTISKSADPRTTTRADVASTKVAPRNLNVLWREPHVESSGHVEVDPKTGAMRLEGVKLQGDTISATLTGVIQDLTTRCDADLAGEFEYDADQLSPVLAANLGMDLQVSGKKREAYAIRGPLMPMLSSISTDFAIPAVMLQPVSPNSAGRQPVITASIFPRDMQLDAALGWSKANIGGMLLGPLAVDAKLRDSLVRIEPLELQMPAGSIRLAPVLDLSVRPYLIRFAPGKVIENAEITPQLCRSWLKYVNPMMADAAEVEGSFSLDLGDSAFPLAQPILGEATGTLNVNQAQIGPSPLSRELIEIGKQIEAVLKNRPPGTVKTWLTMPNQNVRFAVQGGRVFHEGMSFQVRDISITTRGSVGVDQSISLLAEVPIKDEWVAKERILAGLKGQALQIPIGGTLSQPKVDARAITDIGAKMIGGTIKNKIEQELDKGLQKGLDKLLRPKK